MRDRRRRRATRSPHYAMAELREAAGDIRERFSSVGRARRSSIRDSCRRIIIWASCAATRGDTAGRRRGIRAGAASRPRPRALLEQPRQRAAHAGPARRRPSARLRERRCAAARLSAGRRQSCRSAARSGRSRACRSHAAPGARAERRDKRRIGRSSVLLAGLLRERGELDEAAQLYLQAIQATPDQKRRRVVQPRLGLERARRA